MAVAPVMVPAAEPTSPSNSGAAAAKAKPAKASGGGCGCLGGGKKKATA